MKISELTMPEVRRYSAECNFTNDEFLIFKLLSEGCTQEKISELMNYSVSTIKRFKNQIETKMNRLESL